MLAVVISFGKQAIVNNEKQVLCKFTAIKGKMFILKIMNSLTKCKVSLRTSEISHVHIFFLKKKKENSGYFS